MKEVRAVCLAVMLLAWAGLAPAKDEAAPPPEKAAAAEETIPVVSIEKAGDHINQRVTVEGTIVRVTQKEKVAYLDFGDKYTPALSVVIFSRYFDRFPRNMKAAYLNRKVRVTGQVVRSSLGRLRIVTGKPARIDVLD